MNAAFYVLDNNEKVMFVTTNDESVKIEHYKKSVMYPFYHKNEVSVGEVNAFMESRCFNRHRPDRDDLLAFIGLKTYDTWEIVKKTKGKNETRPLISLFHKLINEIL